MRRLHPLHILAAAVVVAFTIPTPALASSAQPAGTVNGPNKGYDAMYNGAPAGNYSVRIEGKDSVAYCADQAKPLHSGQPFSIVSMAESGVPNASHAAWVALNHTGIGTQLADANAEAAAVQIAMWRFTNNIAIDPTTVPDAEVRDRAAALVSAVGTNAVASAPASFVLDLTGTSTTPGNATFTARLTTKSGTPIADRDVTITIGSASQTVRTDTNGSASVQGSFAPGAAAQATARYNGSIPVGAVMIPADGSQPLMIVNPVPVEATAAASITVLAATPATAGPTAPVVTETTVAPQTPTVTEEPVTSAPEVEDELPRTGVLEHAPLRLLAGTVVFAVGMVGLLLQRRRISV